MESAEGAAPTKPRLFTPVADAEALARLFAASNERPVLLFLHDPDCPISANAYDEMVDAARPAHVVDVTTQHDLSRAVAAYTGVRHESPQAFVLRDGKPAWHASHGRIRAKSVIQAVDDATAQAGV